MLETFINYLTYEKRLSNHTICAYRTDLTQFHTYLQAQFQITELNQVTSKVLRSWIIHLSKEGLNNRSINRKVACLRAFYGFLYAKGDIASDVTAQLRSLKIKKGLPIFLREEELLRLLDEYPFEDNFEGWRDKLVLELLYGTGIRLSELLNLQDHDINFYERTIRVLGKRNKERIIPVPKSILAVVENYIAHRNATVPAPYSHLLITVKSNPCYPMLVYKLVNKYLSSYTQADKHSPHVLRHTFATHLLNRGADLQAIKELLGHANLAATQVYTHNSMEKLKEIFSQAHPRA
ncbi:MAG: integrase [Candidatus Amoebophilus sp. 36-38]|nr:MAG: integrase [Candidatus Amoebophilus sp. 36-38]